MSENENGAAEKSVGKGRATPSRKEREQARLRPIIGPKTPEARKAEKARIAESRRTSREGALNGEERYLTPRDKGPQKRLVRDFVDSRFSAGQVLMPALVASVLITFVESPLVQLVVMILLYAFLFALVFNAVLIGRAAKKLVEERFGKDKTEAGLIRYAAMRSAQSRFLRLPKPQVKRGDKI
jgi:hypothetical protein